VQEDVHDFAWTTSPAFVERRQRFEEPGLPPVEMRLLLQPEHDSQADRHFAAARAALKYYGTWFGPYPYPQLTIVDPVTTFNPDAQGEGTDGMEYPTLITAGTHWYNAWADSWLEEVTITKPAISSGTAWWRPMSSSTRGWTKASTPTPPRGVMQEAFPGRFSIVERYFGGLASWAYSDVPWSREIDGDRLQSYRRAAAMEDQSRPSWRYATTAAGGITYSKSAVWLATMERLIGWPATQKVLAAHFQRGAFRHPTPDEFFAIASEVSGRDLPRSLTPSTAAPPRSTTRRAPCHRRTRTANSSTPSPSGGWAMACSPCPSGSRAAVPCACSTGTDGTAGPLSSSSTPNA
jgi:hypothetical protein